MKYNKCVYTIIFIFSLHMSLVFAGGKEHHGGFEYENSRKILEVARDDVLVLLKEVGDDFFPMWPDHWNKIKFISLIEQLQFKPEVITQGKPQEGYLENRMFDYGFDPQTNEPYIAALKPFFEKYSTVPVVESSPWVKEIIRDIQKKVLHEVSHVVWSYDDDEARYFAEYTLTRLLRVFQLHNKSSDHLLGIGTYLEEKYQFSKTPTLSDLKLEKKWMCWQFDAKNNFVVRTDKWYVFSVIDGFGEETVFAFSQKNETGNFVYNQAGLVSRVRRNNNFFLHTLRVFSNDTLLIRETINDAVQSFWICQLSL